MVELVIVGGGVNGCAIARDAALRGISTLLLERTDFGCGTSAWCSRLVHGGLKYLETHDFNLVRESLRERECLLRTAPHLVRPYRMAVPFYRRGRRRAALLEAGMALYDLLSFDKSLPLHRVLGPRAVRRELPGLRYSGLQGAALYYDAQVTWPERLCVELAMDAKALGATVLNQAECTGITRSTDGFLEVRYLCRGVANVVNAKKVVNVAGAWVDAVLSTTELGQSRLPVDPLMRPSKGSHLVVPSFDGAPGIGVFFEGPTDGRPMLVLPWAGRYLIGSTDLFVDVPPDEVTVGEDEIAYILHAANTMFPGAHLGPESVDGAYVGLRPLPNTADGSPGAVSRDFEFIEHDGAMTGVISVVGGKLTTHRALAQKLLDSLFRGRHPACPCTTGHVPLPGSRGAPTAELWRNSNTLVSEVASRSGLPSSVAERLIDQYGAESRQITKLAASDKELAITLDPSTGLTAAEVAHAVENEDARTASDVVLRRTMWAWQSHRADRPVVLSRLVDFLSRRYSWDRESQLLEVKASMARLHLRPLHKQATTHPPNAVSTPYALIPAPPGSVPIRTIAPRGGITR